MKRDLKSRLAEESNKLPTSGKIRSL